MGFGSCGAFIHSLYMSVWLWGMFFWVCVGVLYNYSKQASSMGVCIIVYWVER
jgi:hypothetical protein